MKKQNRITQAIRNGHVDQHVFRTKRLCSSPTYQSAMAEATEEMKAIPPYSHDDLIVRELRHGFHGFFYVPETRHHESGTNAPQSGYLEFRHASKRYKDGWDSGKESRG